MSFSDRPLASDAVLLIQIERQTGQFRFLYTNPCPRWSLFACHSAPCDCLLCYMLVDYSTLPYPNHFLILISKRYLAPRLVMSGTIPLLPPPPICFHGNFIRSFLCVTFESTVFCNRISVFSRWGTCSSHPRSSVYFIRPLPTAFYILSFTRWSYILRFPYLTW
jgi:hypothetical protein